MTSQEQERVAEIAKGLTDAQRRLMKIHPYWATSRYTTIAACRRKGLLDGAELTPLGQQVRDHLNIKTGLCNDR